MQHNRPAEAAPGPFPFATLGLVVLTCAAFGLQQLHPGGIHGAMEQWGEVPRRMAAGDSVPGIGLPAWVTLLSYMFVHSGWDHLRANMLGLALAGASLERRAGPWRLLMVYFGSGIAASAVSVMTQWHSEHALSGASGAVAGVMLAWLLVLPWAWRSGWLPAMPGWHGTGAWVETVLRGVLVLRSLEYTVVWPLVVAASSANWNILAFRTNLTHFSGALAGCVLILPYAVQLWCVPRLRPLGLRQPPRTVAQVLLAGKARLRRARDARPDFLPPQRAPGTRN